MTDRKRANVGSASKVAATGLGLATMFGLVGVMAIDARSSEDGATATSAPMAPVTSAPIAPITSAPVATAPATLPAPVGNQRVVLVPRPAARAVPVTAAPAVRTHGSR